MKKKTTRRDHSKKRTRSVRPFQGMELLDNRTLFTGDIFATILHDLNGNGVKDNAPEEPPLAGWTVFVETVNRNGIRDVGEPFAVTDIDGEAFITGITKGKWDVTEELPAGWSPTSSDGITQRINVDNGEVTDVVFLNEPTGTSGTINGTVWDDVNGDGIRDVGDQGISGWTVFIDTNLDDFLNPGESSTITDGSGFFEFTGLATGRHRVVEIVPADWDTTLGYDSKNNVDVIAGFTETIDFGNFSTVDQGSIGGTVWNDVNADGLRAAGDLGLSGWTIYLDLNSNNSLDASEPSTLTDLAGDYLIPNLNPGTYRVAEVIQPGWNTSPGHPSAVNVTVVQEGTHTATFANFTPANGAVTGTIYSDANGNGIQEIGESGLSNWIVYIDQNGNGVVDASEPSTLTNSSGSYLLDDVSIGTNVIRELPAVGYTPTAPGTGMQTVNVLNATTVSGVNFGNKQRTDGAISGNVYVDSNKNGIRDHGERGLPGITVYIDANNNSFLDAGEKSVVTSIDLFYTPAANEAGNYSFDKLPAGNFVLREIVPVPQNATPESMRVKNITLSTGEDRQGVNFGNIFRPNEIHGIKFNDINENGVRDPGEPAQGGVTVYLDLNRNNSLDLIEPRTITNADGSYAFTGLEPGAYIVRAILPQNHQGSYPGTVGGILWPTGISNPARGNVTTSNPLTFSLEEGQTYSSTVSITLPLTGGLTNAADVFLLFDDTGSFTGNSPIVRAAFPQIINTLQTNLPGMDLGFGVGRLEEYGNFAAEYGTGRPFILNQPILSQSTAGFSTAIQAALDRTAPGYGGDQPETDIEALYQTVTGAGFDGNNNGNTTDSGSAGLASTQTNPGNSGDVPAFSSFTPDPANNVLAPDGTIGGAGFRTGALPVILLATDTGFAYQPKAETSITGINGLTIPVSQMTQTSRNTTPFNSGAGIQETITALNALGALVIGIGTNPQATIDPRQQLEAISKLTGSINTTTTTISNGTTDPIAPGDPLYFQIASGFGASVANGVIAAIQNAVTTTSMNIELKSSDPSVQISMTPGVVNGVGAGDTATFNITFTGDGRPHRFDLQFVRQGTNVVIGSLPVVIGTPVPGDCYEYDDLEEGEIEIDDDFGSYATLAVGGVISGQIFEDRDSDDSHDLSEPYDVGKTVYLDLNNNNTLDAGEPSTITDAIGSYIFTGLADGSYFVRQAESTSHAGENHNVTLATSSATSTNFSNIPIAFAAHTGMTTFNVTGNGAYAEISVDGTPTYSILKSDVPSLTFDAAAGDTTVIVDFSTFDPAPAGGILLTGGDAGDIIEVRGNGAGDQFSIGTAGQITHGSSTIDFTGMGKLKLAGGLYDITTDLGNIDLSVSGAAAQAVLRQSQHLKTLNLDGGALVHSDSTDPLSPAMVVGGVSITNGKLVITPNGGISGVSKLGSLTLGANGLIDLNNNDLIIDYGTNPTPLTVIESALASGLPILGGNATSGIGSSQAGLGFNGTFIGILDNGSVGGAVTSLSGFTDFSSNSILVKYTWFGDSNLDGAVDGSDYALIDTGLTSGGTNAGWVFGDLDYSGQVDASDYALIDTGFGAQNAVL